MRGILRGALDDNGELKMSLFEHLQELRSRLLKITLSVLVLGIVSLVFARPIFGILMKPVLEALPPDQRSLIYTSGIEELNVLMKVGMYAGVFLTTPIILWQLWSFVAPGLYPSERRYASPFVILGSLAFIGGALFCYFVILPSMFQFLLRNSDAAGLEDQVVAAKLREDDALRALRLGDMDRSLGFAKAAVAELSKKLDEDFVKAPGADRPSPMLEASLKLEGLGRLMDAAGEGYGPAGRPVLRNVMDTRSEALTAYEKGDFQTAIARTESAASALAGINATETAGFGELWKLERLLAEDTAKFKAMAWTRPMLTMSEQLSLVLLLELAFGVIFELPLVIALLASLGLVKASFLLKYQRHAFVICLILAAIITPTGDAVNLALMAGPMLLCYELGVLAAWFIEKRRAKAAATTAITPAR